jgi:AraC-like DNA-binding protein
LDKLEWLLAEEAVDFSVPNSPRFMADDENWRATIEHVEFGPGLDVFLNDIQVRRDIRAGPMRPPQAGAALVGQVAIAGGVDLDLGDGVEVKASRRNAVLYRQPEQPCVHVFKGGTRLHSVGYRVDVARVAHLFDGDVPSALRALVDGDDGIRAIDARNDDALRSAAHRLFSSGLNGALRRLMMEGVVLQLLALQIAAIGQDLPTRQRGALSTREQAAIHEARQRLLADMRRTPTLDELAGAVGLTEKRLNSGFRRLFGATVFETMRNARLDQAKSALEEGTATLKEISFRVGYDHVSNFVHAFRRRFGAPPRQYLGSDAGERRSVV